MFTHIIRAEYLDAYRLRLWFNDGAQGIADLAHSLEGPVFTPLRDPAQFKQFHLECGTVAWSNGADFAPEYLRELANLPVMDTGHKAAA